MALSKSIQKVNEYTKQNSGFFDLAEPYGLFRKLKVEGKSQLREIQYYHGGALRSHEYLPKSRQLRGELQPNIELETLLSDRRWRHICFVGPAGIGKTTLMKSIARGVLEGIYRGLSNVVMVLFLHCRDYKPNDLVSVGEFLFGKTDLTNNEIKSVFKLAITYPERVLFILDSLDTLQYNVDGVYKFINLHEKACPEAILWNFLSGNIFPGCQVISSSREYTISKYKGEVRPGKVITILGLTKKSIMEVVIGYVGEIEAKEFMHYLETKAPSLQTLCTTPVILVYSLIGYKASLGFTPTTSTGCLIVVLQSIIRSQHTHHEDILAVMHKLEELSYNGIQEGRVLFTYDDLDRVGLKPQDATDLTIFAPGGFTEKLLQGQSRLFFTHQTLQEVFSTLWISKMVEDCFKKFVASSLNTSRYVNVKKFLYGIFFDIEVNMILSKDLRQGDNGLQTKIEILREDIRSQLSQNLTNADLLEFLISLSEAKDGVSDIIKSSLHRAVLKNLPLSPSDVFAIGSVISQCDHLDELWLIDCNLDASSLNLLVSLFNESRIKLRTLSLDDNINIGIDGISAVGRLVTRNDVEVLSLQRCRLTSEQLQRLTDSARNATKWSELVLVGNRNMDIAGIWAVGRIIIQNNVEKANLSDCDLTAEQLATLKHATKDATELSVLNLSEKRTATHEDIAAVANLLTNVKDEVQLFEWKIEKEDVVRLQSELNELGKEGLQVKKGLLNEDTLCAEVEKTNSEKLPISGDLETKENSENEFPDAAEVKSSKSSDSDGSYKDANESLSSEADDDDHQIEPHFLSFTQVKDKILSSSKGKEVACIATESSRKLYEFLQPFGLGDRVKFYITPHLYYNAWGVFRSFFCIKDRPLDDEQKKGLCDNGYINALSAQEPLVAGLKDRINVHLKFISPECYCMEPESGKWKFKITKQFIDLGYTSFDFELNEVPETVQQGCFRIHFLHGKKKKTPLNRRLRIDWPPLLQEDRQIPSKDSLKRNPKKRERGESPSGSSESTTEASNSSTAAGRDVTNVYTFAAFGPTSFKRSKND